ncbi:MAG: hypothetical protein Harvfovirus51_10 [Harvfovirus sp.]|uniref:Uncharacterized protein n=1 Tax=Harvfovirus sp. TaxID=2487768 RepID=A0A3G5A381_9VIRU|nr:MAG: hypothetical protein Harvfovirus51_10 [Harvfovirus sp.]
MDHNQKKEEFAGTAQEIEDDVQQDMTSETTEQTTTTSSRKDTGVPGIQLKTPFGDIEYKPDLKLSRASIMQLINCYTYRLNKQQVQVDNKWQEFAYPQLQKMFTGLSEIFTQAVLELYNSEEYDKEVVLINFCGYKNFKLPLIVQTPGVHHRATYSSVNVRPFLKTIEQRLMYLSTVKTPARYKDDEKKVTTFNKVQVLAESLRTKYVLPLHESWKKLCQDAADFAGIVVEPHERVVEQRRRVPAFLNRQRHRAVTNEPDQPNQQRRGPRRQPYRGKFNQE